MGQFSNKKVKIVAYEKVKEFEEPKPAEPEAPPKTAEGERPGTSNPDEENKEEGGEKIKKKKTKKKTDDD